jgi:2-keto-4-pentenoate hydratase/2-oxohepta-3-ene-1,7-dioic acid hydratase in catechol pathway
MRLASFHLDGADRYGVIRGSRLLDASAEFGAELPTLRSVLAADRLSELARWAEGRDAGIGIDSVRLLPPIPDPGKILCCGLNYFAHRSESGIETPPTYPTFFIRFADTQVGSGNPLLRPPASRQFDYEGELAVVIGRPVRGIPASSALEAVAGYACYNDASARDWQGHGLQWTPGKNFPGTGAFGPYLVTAEEVQDPTALTLVTWVNGEERQRARIADLMVGIPELISYASQFTPLSPGDVIVTGTPAGAGMFRDPPAWLQDGDEVLVEISGLGMLRNIVRSAGEPSEPEAMSSASAPQSA